MSDERHLFTLTLPTPRGAFAAVRRKANAAQAAARDFVGAALALIAFSRSLPPEQRDREGEHDD